MAKQMKVTDLVDMASKMSGDLILRGIDKPTVARYSELMRDKVTFPPIVVGNYPITEKYGTSAIVDGLHRITGAKDAGVEYLPVEIVQYDSIQDMLADMYKRNMLHGIPVKEGDRNARIVFLRKQGWTLEKVAKVFNLGKSSIDRIEKGEQGEGPSGRKKGGAIRSKGQNSQKAKSASQVHKLIEKLNIEFHRKRLFSDYLEFLSPASDDEPEGELDEERMNEVLALITFLQTAVKEARKNA